MENEVHFQLNLPEAEIHYLHAERGPEAVLLIHGAGSDYSQLSWKYTFPALTDRFRVYAPDLPGYGRSSKNISSPLIPFYANILKQFLDKLDIEQVHLVGLSMGGAIALQFTLSHPTRVSKLVLVSSYGLTRHHLRWAGSALWAKSPAIFYGIRRTILRHSSLFKFGLRFLVGDPDNISEELINDVRQAYKLMGNGEAWRQFILEEIKPFTYRTCFSEQLSRLSQPVLVIHGEKDRLIPLKHIRKVIPKIPHCQFVIFENCGHWPPREFPKKFNQQILSFLTEN